MSQLIWQGLNSLHKKKNDDAHCSSTCCCAVVRQKLGRKSIVFDTLPRYESYEEPGANISVDYSGLDVSSALWESHDHLQRFSVKENGDDSLVSKSCYAFDHENKKAAQTSVFSRIVSSNNMKTRVQYLVEMSCVNIWVVENRPNIESWNLKHC